MRKMLLKNAFVHDGLGHVAKQDVLVEDGEIKQVADSLPGEGEDLSGCHLLPGFIDALSYWGINGSMTEIRPLQRGQRRAQRSGHAGAERGLRL